VWRRIPILPMLFGAAGALAILSVFSLGEPRLVDWRPYVSAAALGAAYVLALYTFVVAVRVPDTVVGALGCGCFYAAAGYFFLLMVVLVGAIAASNRSVQIKDAAAFASLFGFVGLGILGGMTLARFRRSEAARQRAALEAQAAEFAREQLEIARDLQQRLLPPPTLQTDRYRLTASNVPAAYVAGDFYDFVPLGADRLLIVLADVAGKGVGAGLIMATVKAMVPLLAAEQAHPAPLLGRLNEQLAGQLAQREFVAMIVALYDAQLGRLTMANAGLPDPVLLPALRPIAVEGPRYPIGIRKNLSYESLVVNIAPGERVIFFTDGLPEATVAGEPLGYERLSIELKRAEGEIPRLFAALESLGAAHDDDWTAVLLERLR
jgi:hypothetical protein